MWHVFRWSHLPNPLSPFSWAKICYLHSWPLQTSDIVSNMKVHPKQIHLQLFSYSSIFFSLYLTGRGRERASISGITWITDNSSQVSHINGRDPTLEPSPGVSHGRRSQEAKIKSKVRLGLKHSDRGSGQPKPHPHLKYHSKQQAIFCFLLTLVQLTQLFEGPVSLVTVPSEAQVKVFYSE